MQLMIEKDCQKIPNVLPFQEILQLSDPIAFYQKGKIGGETKFLRLSYRDPDSLALVSTWLWDKESYRLVNFLINYLIRNSASKELGIEEKKDYRLSDIMAMNLKDMAVVNKVDLKVLLPLASGEQELEDALFNDEDLNAASDTLLDATGRMFFSLMWEFCSLEQVKDILKKEARWDDGAKLEKILAEVTPADI